MSKPKPTPEVDIPGGDPPPEDGELPMDDRKGPGRPSVATKLLELALQHFRLGQDQTGKPFAVRKTGPWVRLAVSEGAGVLGELQGMYEELTGKVPGHQAISDTKRSLVARALRQDAEIVPIRTYYHAEENTVVIDLGDSTGRAIVVTEDGWGIKKNRLVVFWRTNCTLPYEYKPVPSGRGSPDAMRKLFNFSDRVWDFLVNWQVTCFVSGIPHPVPIIEGPPGIAKTATTRLLTNIIDPSKAPLNGPPRNEEQLMVAANGSWALALENISYVPTWLSDALCRLTTGSGGRTRSLYTNDDIHVMELMRVMIINGVEPVGLRPDLLDRSIRIMPQPISEDERLTEEEINTCFAEAAPAHLGYLLDVLSKVLRLKANEHGPLPIKPGRMADFDGWLYRIDQVRGTKSLEWWADRRKADVISAALDDVVVIAIEQALKLANLTELDAPAAVWLAKINDHRPTGVGKQWPSSGKAFGQRLRQHTRGLKLAGWEVRERTRDGRLWWRIVPTFANVGAAED